VLSSVEPADVHHPDERASAIFYGRPALNLDFSRRLADLQPGTSGEALERHYFGAVRPDAASSPSRRRYPVIALRMPGQWWRVPGFLRASYVDSLCFWQSVVAPGMAGEGSRALADLERARATLFEARRRFERIARPHSVLALLGGALMQQVTLLAEAAGQSERVLEALGGYDSIEFETLKDLIAVRRGELGLAEFLRVRGFQGPQQGELSSTSWREDPAPIRALLESLDANDGRVATIAPERALRRTQAEDSIASGLSPLRRAFARWLFREAARMLPERESGKAAMMLCLDAARAAARRIGLEHARMGRLEDPEDVFYLTLDEIESPFLGEVRERVAQRRAQREAYLALELPESWIGMVVPLSTQARAGDSPLAGLGASAGIAEGCVRVVADGAGELHPGEILVCTATDPSYAAYFLVAAGVITDIGGAMGHGAIVAREVGIPCVVNTRDATRRLCTGDRVRLDGTTGSIEILARSGPQSNGGVP
jgi:phosphohistidine swiveling domain-containing protein